MNESDSKSVESDNGIEIKKLDISQEKIDCATKYVIATMSIMSVLSMWAYTSYKTMCVDKLIILVILIISISFIVLMLLKDAIADKIRNFATKYTHILHYYALSILLPFFILIAKTPKVLMLIGIGSLLTLIGRITFNNTCPGAPCPIHLAIAETTNIHPNPGDDTITSLFFVLFITICIVKIRKYNMDNNKTNNKQE